MIEGVTLILVNLAKGDCLLIFWHTKMNVGHNMDCKC